MYDEKNMSKLKMLTFIISVLSAGCAIAAIVSIQKMQKLRTLFFAGKKAGDLEQLILNQNKKINELHAQLDYVEETVKALAERQKFSIQKLGVIRYNPFQDDGGNLSFSMAVLDDHNNGVVITSLHGREANRTYAKPIKEGRSDFGLTGEEEKAIATARNF